MCTLLNTFTCVARGLYYKTLRICNLQKTDKFHKKLASSGLDNHIRLDKQSH